MLGTAEPVLGIYKTPRRIAQTPCVGRGSLDFQSNLLVLGRKIYPSIFLHFSPSDNYGNFAQISFGGVWGRFPEGSSNLQGRWACLSLASPNLVRTTQQGKGARVKRLPPEQRPVPAPGRRRIAGRPFVVLPPLGSVLFFGVPVRGGGGFKGTKRKPVNSGGPPRKMTARYVLNMFIWRCLFL